MTLMRLLFSFSRTQVIGKTPLNNADDFESFEHGRELDAGTLRAFKNEC